MYVYFYLFTRAGLARLDAAVFEAAASLGAGRWRTLRRVVLPLLYPALGAGALLTFMTALASFSAPYIFGGGFRVMTTQIVATRLNGDDQLAMIETVSLTLIALACALAVAGSRAVESPARRRKGVAPALVPMRRRRCSRGDRGTRLGACPRVCCCPISRCCWSPLCRRGPGPPSRCRRRIPGATTSP